MTLAALTALLLTADAHAGKRSDVAQRLNRGLAGTPMQGTGWKLEHAAHRHNVSPYLIAAIAGVESSYGRVHCRQSRYWVFGLGSCGRNWTPPLFRSWGHAYDYMARFLRDRWISRGASSATSIGYTYCPPCGSRWGAAVDWHMSRLGWPTRVTYR